MSDQDRGVDGAWHALEASTRAWTEQGQPTALARWLDRELDPDGVPRRLEVARWLPGLGLIREAIERRPETWPDRHDALIEGWFRALLRFSRPEGSTVFATEATRPDAVLFRFWADRLSDPGLSTVVDRWFPRAAHPQHAPPPLPADSRPDRPLAVLRANWVKNGDILAVDHRALANATRFELIGAGVRWLGPCWESFPSDRPVTKAKPTLWVSRGSADAAEWTFRVGAATVTRTAVFLRGRRLALLAEQWNGPGDPGAFALRLADGVQANRVQGETRAWALSPARGRSSARVLPIGLPMSGSSLDRGELDREGRDLVLRMPAREGERRIWRALLISWEPQRNRRTVFWRGLTVSQLSKVSNRDVAVGARISWGRDDSLLIYRSLAAPALRSVLGHQTRARFLIGLFSREGNVEPLLKVDE